MIRNRFSAMALGAMTAAACWAAAQAADAGQWREASHAAANFVGLAQASESGQEDIKPVIYVPPMRGAPTRRVGGATRGAENGAVPTFAVLAPEAMGLTGRVSPTLYWYLGADTDKRFVFTLVNEQEIDPVAEFDLQRPMAKGFVPVYLAARNITLRPEVTYEWSVALVDDPTQRSNNVITSGTIKWTNMDLALAKEIEALDPETRLARYAQNGYWYDAIELIFAALAGGKDIPKWRAYRASLLEQVGLPVAESGVAS